MTMHWYCMHAQHEVYQLQRAIIVMHCSYLLFAALLRVFKPAIDKKACRIIDISKGGDAD
jgi:hypothetical protein